MQKIKDIIKLSYGGILLSLCISFMLMFYEPINMYANNLDDFWFDIYTFVPFVLAQFIVSFFALSLLFIIINLINKKAYKFVLISAFILTIIGYIQGNFLIGNLPAISGDTINYDLYTKDKIISIILWVLIIGSSLFTLYKIKYEKFEKVIKYSSLIIVAILFVTSISFIAKPHFLDKKDETTTTYKNFSNLSSDKNYLIFLIDQVDSKTFNEEIEKYWNKKELLKDFTYYPDTTSTYLWTQYSIPFIFGGEWYENDSYFKDYFTKQIDNAELFNKLEKENYQLNLYENYEITNYNGNNLDRFDNIILSSKLNKKELFKQEIKYVLFKYLPFQLKKYSKIESFSINDTKIGEDYEPYISWNRVPYGHIKEDTVNIVEDKYFQFIHIEGGHAPFQYKKDLSYTDNGTYRDSIDASITILESYLKRLKDNNSFDNSVIVIMADHGYGEKTIERGNPILYIKGFNEKHDYKVSNKKISFENIPSAFVELLEGSKTDDIFIDLDNSERRILYCELHHCETLTEMIQKGNAWNTNTIVETGKEYVKK